MSLLDTASLILTPNGYKGGVTTGKLYSVKPTDASGDMVVTRNTTATRVNSSGLIENVAINAPRLDYTGGGCPKILVEPLRTNLVPNGLGFSSATGVLYDTTVIDSPAIGINSARITKNEVSGTIRYAQQTCSTAVLLGSTTYTISRYFKYDGYNITTSMQFNTIAPWGGTGWVQTIIIASTGVSLGTNSNCTSTIQNAGNGWYRVNVTITTGAVITGGSPSYLMVLQGSLSVGQGFLTALPQLEVGTTATSYIPTTTIALARNADSFTLNNIYTNGLLSASGGTWFVNLINNIPLTRDVDSVGLNLDVSLGNNGFAIRNNAAAQRLTISKYISNARTDIYLTTTNTCKIAIKWNGTTADIFENGTKVVSATSFTPTAMQVINGISTDVSKNINQMSLWATPLSDPQCISLTT